MVRQLKRSLLVVACVIQHAFAQPVEFRKADSIAEMYAGHSMKDLELLSHRLTDSLSTEKEKFRSIFKWVCENVEADYAMAETNLSNRRQLTGDALNTWNRDFSAKTMRTLLNHYRTVCTGYAWLVCSLSKHANIPCEIVNGYGRNSRSEVGKKDIPNHSWNAVQLNNQWFLCDPTWSSGAVNATTKVFIPSFEEYYFLTDPGLFVRNHFPLDTAWTFLPDPPSYEEFLNGPVVYSNAFRYNVQSLSHKTFRISASKGESISFILQSNYEGDILMLINSASIGRMIKGNNLFSIEHTFKRSGTFPIYFLIDNRYVIGYEVTVQ